MIREALEDGKGINTIRQISQTSDMQMTQSYWQRVSNSFNIMIDKLDVACEQYGMEMNAKKTKTMIVEKALEELCEVNNNNII